MVEPARMFIIKKKVATQHEQGGGMDTSRGNKQAKHRLSFVTYVRFKTVCNLHESRIVHFGHRYDTRRR